MVIRWNGRKLERNAERSGVSTVIEKMLVDIETVPKGQQVQILLGKESKLWETKSLLVSRDAKPEYCHSTLESLKSPMMATTECVVSGFFPADSIKILKSENAKSLTDSSS